MLGLSVGLLAACGDDAGEAADRHVSVSDAWALATVTGQPNGAVYFTVVSTAADTLQRIVVPSSIADHAEIHETVTNTKGEMAMQEMSSGVPLEPGTAVTFTIEPMITLGTWQHKMWDDDWTAVTADGKRTAQFEHTVLVTDDGVDVLTGGPGSVSPTAPWAR